MAPPTPASLRYEKHLWAQNYQTVVGIDEAGRGAWVGPLTVAAVIFPKNVVLPRLYDSKQISPKKRLKLRQQIEATAICYSVIHVSVEEINRHNIGRSTQIGFNKVLDSLTIKPDYILTDAYAIQDQPSTRQLAIIKGDSLSRSIAAASILAKTYRDELMENLDYTYPYYDLRSNKGYGTKAHTAALEKYGPSDIHRTSFKNIAALIKRREQA